MLFEPLEALGTNDLWYALPLVVVVSLVYKATRYEQMDRILREAAHTAVWITGVLVAVFALLVWMSWGL